MATGKSTVAPLVAASLDRPFVDTDAQIVERAGMPIREIFERHGERYFRKLEAEICVDLAAETGLVVATGGGALLNADTLVAMSSTGMVACLTASPTVLASRLADGTAERPLASDWQVLYEQRKP
ncbi:MAG: shikimate kinase, partial [Chloroflexota bacterium]